MKKGTKKCWNYEMEIPYRLHGLDVCTATHPDKPNFSGHSRGRKIHLAKTDKLTVCNMLIDQYCPSSNQNYSMVMNGKCGNCFNEKAIQKAKSQNPLTPAN
jgi:hypothetical protein